MAGKKASGSSTRWVMPKQNFYVRELDIDGKKGVPVELPTQVANRIVSSNLGEIITRDEAAEAAPEQESEEAG